jgi:hypothetical protein
MAIFRMYHSVHHEELWITSYRIVVYGPDLTRNHMLTFNMMFGHSHWKPGLISTLKQGSELVAINTLTKIETNRTVQEEIIEIIKNAGGFW